MVTREMESKAEFFEFEYCGECHGDAEDHTEVEFMGNPFYRCNGDAVCHLEGCDIHKATKGE